MHDIWLQLTRDPRYSGLHHYEVVALALKELERELQGPDRDRLVALLQREIDNRAGASPRPSE